MTGLQTVDWVVTATSLLLVIGVALFTSLRKRGGSEDAPTMFFLAGRQMPWWISAASLFASNLGTEHFVGQAGLAATSGMAVSIYEWGAAYLLVALGWVFAPVYLKMRLKTMPEYLERRFDHRCRAWFVMLTMVTYVVTKIGASLFSGAVILDVLADLNIWTSTPLILVATAIYTAIGGLTAVMFTDTFQTVIFTVGGLIGAAYSLDVAGGMSGLKETLRERDLGWFLHTVHPIDDKDFPWPAMFVGLTFGAALFYWCVDQEMTQRVLSAASLEHAQLGCVIAGFLKTLPFLITILPGMVARVLYEKCLASQGTEFAVWCTEGAEDMSDASDSTKAYPLLILREFPAGIKGVMVTSFLAAMMSSLSSVFNSASTIFTYDVYLRFMHPHGDVTAGRLVLVGRVTTMVLTVFSLLWLPIIQSSNDGVYLVTQTATSHVVGPISAVFVMALFWPRANAAGAFTSLVLGSCISILRLILTLLLEDYCDDFTRDEGGRSILRTTWRNWIFCMNFNHFAILLFAFCCLTVVIVSLIYAPPDQEAIQDCLFVWPRWMGHFSGRRSGGESLEVGKSLIDPETETSLEPHDTPVGDTRRRIQHPVVVHIMAVMLVIGITILIGFSN